MTLFGYLDKSASRVALLSLTNDYVYITPTVTQLLQHGAIHVNSHL